MKKYFFFAACASVAFASCVNDVPDLALESQQKIVFEAPVVSPSTRVDEIANNYPTTESFKVWAHYYKNGTYSTFAEGTMFMNNVTCNYDDVLKGWSAGDYYFPKNGSLTFMAYSPSSVTGASIVANGINFTDYVVDGDVSKQVDLLYSERAYNKEEIDDMATIPYAGVTLNFKHALSSIRFAVKAYADYGATKIYIKKIEVVNAYSKANFQQPLIDGNNNTTGLVTRDASDFQIYTNFGWDNHNVATTYVAYNQPSPTVPLTTSLLYPHNDMKASIVSNKTDLILIPQLLKHSDSEHVKVRVTYNLVNPGGVTIEQVSEIDLVTGNGGGYYDGYESDLSTKIVEDVTAWERGKRYTYVISVALDKIYFEPVVAPWDDIYVAPGI